MPISSGVSEPPDVVRMALEALPLAVLMADHEGVIALINRAGQRLFGYDRSELVGRSVDLLIPHGWWAQHLTGRHQFSPASASRALPVGVELLARRKDGSEFPVEIALSSVDIGTASMVIASVTDLTDRLRVERERLVARDERRKFERVVAEVGAEFTRLQPEEVDRAIEDALGRVGGALGLDRTAVFEVEDSGDFVHTHTWTRPGGAPPPPRVSAREQFPWQLAQLLAGELVSIPAIADVPDDADRVNLGRLGTKSTVVVPMSASGRTYAVSFATVRQSRKWGTDVIARLRIVALIFANALAGKQADEALRHTIAESTALRDRLQNENAYLRRELNAVTRAPAPVGQSKVFRRVLEQVHKVAATDSPVVLQGETGTGKSLLAARIHELSGRNSRPMVHVNCGALTGVELDAELFGVEKGGDDASEPRHIGRLELADRSTIFLSDVADLPLGTQAGLVRLLADGSVHPLGGTTPVKTDVRIIAATRKDLPRCIDDGIFRDDLYERLNRVSIHVPPLRERPDDIPLLVWRFVDEFSEAYNMPIDTIDKATMAALQGYHWPGNARELRSVVERAMIVADGRHLHIPLPGAAGSTSDRTLAAVEKQHITATLVACDWHVRGRHGAAAQLGLSPRALETKMAELDIRRRPRE
jgi:PAS domain S-box-containing protein